MIELGKTQELEIVRTKEFGVYLSEKAGDEAAVLLPKKQVPAGAKIGDKVTVFIYKDSSDRLIATTGTPKLELGQCFWTGGWKKICCFHLKSRPIRYAREKNVWYVSMQTRATDWLQP